MSFRTWEAPNNILPSVVLCTCSYKMRKTSWRRRTVWGQARKSERPRQRRDDTHNENATSRTSAAAVTLSASSNHVLPCAEGAIPPPRRALGHAQCHVGHSRPQAHECLCCGPGAEVAEDRNGKCAQNAKFPTTRCVILSSAPFLDGGTRVLQRGTAVAVSMLFKPPPVRRTEFG